MNRDATHTDRDQDHGRGNGVRPDTGDLLANIPSEQVILGTALYTPHAIAELRDLVHTDTFVRPAHQELWDVLGAAYDAGDPVTPETSWPRLSTTTGKAAIPGVDGLYLADLVALAAPGGGAYVHARRIADLAELRDLNARSNEIARRTIAPDADPVEIRHAMHAWFEDALTAHTGATTGSSWTPVDLDAALRGESLDPPPTMLQRSDGVPLLYASGVHAISGESESGKTWLTLVAAVQLLTDGHTVVFIDFEDRAERVVARLLALGAHPDQIRDQFRYIRPDRALDAKTQRDLEPHLHKAALAIIDGVTEAMTMHGYETNSNDDAARFYAQLPRWIADRGPAVVMIDHVVKDPDRQGRYALGAQHKLAGLDAASYIVKVIQPFARGRVGVARVEIAKDRPGHVREHAAGKTIAEFTLDATHDHTVVATLAPSGEHTGRSGDGWEPTHLMEKVSRYVEAHPGISQRAIEEAVKGKAATIRLSIELLVSGEYLRREPGPNRTNYHYSDIAYREDGSTE